MYEYEYKRISTIKVHNNKNLFFIYTKSRRHSIFRYLLQHYHQQEYYSIRCHVFLTPLSSLILLLYLLLLNTRHTAFISERWLILLPYILYVIICNNFLFCPLLLRSLLPTSTSYHWWWWWWWWWLWWLWWWWWWWWWRRQWWWGRSCRRLRK